MAAMFAVWWLVFDQWLGVVNFWTCVAIAVLAPLIWHIQRQNKLKRRRSLTREQGR
jgi:hypothetical protein